MKLAQLYQDNNHAFQRAAYTCGPVTLLNILRQKGNNSHTEKELAELCDSKPETGTTNENLINGAEAVSLEVVEAKVDATIDEIEKHIDQGKYVVVNYFYAFSNQGHYAQVADHDERALYLVDPSAGYMRIKKEYFESHWHSEDSSVVRWFMALT